MTTEPGAAATPRRSRNQPRRGHRGSIVLIIRRHEAIDRPVRAIVERDSFQIAEKLCAISETAGAMITRHEG